MNIRNTTRYGRMSVNREFKRLS